MSLFTLDSFFPLGATRGDGRKFCSISWGDNDWVQPMFKDNKGYWHTISNLNDHFSYDGSKYETWKEWTPPKKTKKVTMYRPVYKGYGEHYRTLVNEEWHTDKDNATGKNVLGWMAMEAEVDE
jgi:hypothetical protein